MRSSVASPWITTVREPRLPRISNACLATWAELTRGASVRAEGNVFWTDQNHVFHDEDRPVLSRKQALDKFGQYLLSYKTVDAESKVVSYG